MKFIRGIHNIGLRGGGAATRGGIAPGCVLTVGNFDGVHRGHRAIIEQLAALAAELDAPSTLLTFEPHPRELFLAEPPARLTRLREKLAELRGTPLDRMLCVRFDRRFAQQSPQAFIDELLVARLGVRALVVGDDFRFGRGGAGDLALLRQAGERHGFRVLRCATYEHRGRRVSSSWVREALAAGDLVLAETLLGRPYRICGRVAQGDRIGRTIGYPTANVVLGRRALALAGVYAVRVHGLNGHDGPAVARPGVANVGVRPTVRGREPRLEVHLLNFDGNVYGRLVEVEFVERVRDERRFESLDALKAQIARDVARARVQLGMN